MRKIKFEQLIIVVLLIIVIFQLFFSSPKVEVKTGINNEMFKLLLDQQKEEIIQQVEKNKQNEAIKSINNIDSLMLFRSKRDSLRAAAFNR